ncbi:MAG: DUF3494 domain-containing protein [Coriobacteriia bacterium]|nr:DUF3494 domain-containing protein [Coriobacteriia bacterium]
MVRILRKIGNSVVVSALLLVFMGIQPLPSFAAQPTVELGTASTFAVLAGQTITNTGPTTIRGNAGGDAGVFSGSAFTGQAQVTQINGAVHLADTLAGEAQDALTAAYLDAAGRTPFTTIGSELGGKTLKPGVYRSTSGAFQITGTLTLDAQGDPNAVFIFQTATTLITGSGSNVSRIDSALPCKVFWQVGSSATLGTNSHFVGRILALTSIAAQNGATVRGQLLARNGEVTLDTNTITNDICGISVSKVADPSALNSGPGNVTYTYTVKNPGADALSNVTVTDDKIGSLTRVSGDVNGDNLLDPSETWVYTATVYLDATTTNTVTATGEFSGATATDTASVTVTVNSESGTGGTISGGKLPKTATPWYNILLAGVALTFVGVVGCWRIIMKRRVHE